MLNSRKWISLSLATVTALSLLAGCGSSGAKNAAPATTSIQTGAAAKPTKPADLQYLIWDQNQVPVIDQQIKDFTTANPGSKITVNVMPYDDYWTKLQTSIAGGAGPDMYWMTRPNYDIWSRLGTAADIDGLIATHPDLKKNVDSMEPFAVQSYKYEGKFHGVPWGVDSTAIVYNEDALKAAGLKPLSEIEDSFTWDVLRDYANKLTRREGDRIVKYGFMVPPSRYWWDFVWSNGGQFFNEDGSKFVLDSPENVEALQFLADMQLKDKVSPTPAATQSESPTDMFMSGKIAMMQAGSWQLATFNTIKGFKWNVVQFPKSPKTGKRGSTSNVMGYIVNPNAKDKEAVATFLTSLVSAPSQRRLAETGIAIPVLKEAQAPFFDANLPPGNRSAFQKALAYATPMKFSRWVSYQEFIKATNDAMSGILTGARPVDAALREASDKINKSIQEAQKK